jgi:hypothetical protein
MQKKVRKLMTNMNLSKSTSTNSQIFSRKCAKSKSPMRIHSKKEKDLRNEQQNIINLKINTTS